MFPSIQRALRQKHSSVEHVLYHTVFACSLFSGGAKKSSRLSLCTQKQVNCFENIAFHHRRTKRPELFTKVAVLIIAGEQKELQLVISLAPLLCERNQFYFHGMKLEWVFLTLSYDIMRLLYFLEYAGQPACCYIIILLACEYKCKLTNEF